MRLKRKFFNRNTIIVAKELLGKFLIRKIGNKVIKAKITETEAYCGARDLACHASKGLTPRTKVMFGPPGYAYIYMIYGMYHCLNVITEKEGNPSAVLVRAAEIPNPKLQIPNKLQLPNSKQFRSLDIGNYLGFGACDLVLKLDGPGILCRELKIDKKLNGVDLCKSRELWIESGGIKIKPAQIKKGKRIGVDYAGKWKNKLWRFYV